MHDLKAMLAKADDVSTFVATINYKDMQKLYITCISDDHLTNAQRRSDTIKYVSLYLLFNKFNTNLIFIVCLSFCLTLT